MDERPSRDASEQDEEDRGGADGPRADPPTAEVPRLLPPDDRAPASDRDDLDVWSSLDAAPRWRDAGPDGWDDQGDRVASRARDAPSGTAALGDRDRPARGDLFASEDIEEPTAVDTEDEWIEDPELADAGARPRRGRRGRSGSGARASGRSGTDRDLPTAVVVGVGLALAAIVAMWIGPAVGVAFAAVVVTFCAAELFGALQRVGYQPATLLGLVATASLVLGAYWRGEAALPLVLALTVVFTLLWYLVGVTRTAPTSNAGLTIFVVAYVGLFGSFAALMLRLPNGTGILLGTVLAVVANDVGALFAGRKLGRAPIAADISPNKTIEGAVGGAVAAIVVSFVVLDLIGVHPWSAKGGSALALGLLVAVLAPVGDLVESMVKRDLEVKDMGSILPGHGGLIDRFDSLLFVLPAVYYLARLLEIA